MITELHIECFIACLIGNVIHLAFLLSSRAKDARAANEPFSFLQLISIEKYGLIFDFVGSVGLVFAADEIVDSPWIMGKIKLGFILIGIGGSYVVMQFFGQSKKIIRKVVDKKTDIADNKTE